MTTETIKQTPAEIRESTQKIVEDFNKPYKLAVAINASGIGDDNDYSCFLSRCWYQLWLAGQKELALELANTDPLLHTAFTPETLEQEGIRHSKFIAEQKENEDLYYRNYRD